MSGWGIVGQIAGNLLGDAVTNAHNSHEAKRDRRFQEQQARRAMHWSSAEALANRDFQDEQATRAMGFEDKQATRQMDFQERMSSTQVQRAAADAEAAGLNRILALGQPANAPMGASARSASASGAQGSGFSASGSRAAPGVRSQPGTDYMQAASARAAIDNMQAQNDLIRAQTGNVMADTEGKMSLNEAKELMSHLPSIINNLFGDKPSSGFGVRDATEKLKQIIRDYVEEPSGERPFWKKNIFEHGEAGINWLKDKVNRVKKFYTNPPRRNSK